MKRIFTKTWYALVAIVLLVGAALPGLAQNTTVNLETGKFASAMAKDASGNIYVLHVTNGSPGGGSTASIVKYTNGTGTASAALVTGISDESAPLDWATGMTVLNNGDIYYITDNGGSDPSGGNGSIMKLHFNGSTWDNTSFKAGTGTEGFYTALASDGTNLYAVEYSFAGNSNYHGIGSYQVVEFIGLSTTPTVRYDKLGLAGLDNALDNNSSTNYSVPTGLTIAPNGDIYVTDGFSEGAAINDGGKIIKLTAASSYAATTISTGFSATALALDASGNLFALHGTSTTVPAINYGLYKYPNAAATQTPTAIYTPLHAEDLYPYGLVVVHDQNIFVADGSDRNNSHFNAVINIVGAPLTQATNVTFSNINQTTATVSWTNGSGDSRAVFMKNSNTGQPAPVNSTSYSSSTVFGSGSQIGATGWYCVYNGTGSTNSINVTGLTQGQNYQVMVVEYNGPTGAQNYLQSSGTGNPNTFTTISPTTINSLNRVAGQYSNAATVSFAAVFGSAVTGVSASNFSVTTTGVSGVTNASIGTPTTSDNITWTVPVSTGTGDGTIQLNLANATGMSKTISTSLPFAGQSYTIDKTAPTISIGSPSVSIAAGGPVSYTVTYADANFNSSTLSAGNIILNSTGTANASSIVVSGSGTTRNVTISGITGDGTLGISIATGTATDLAGNSAPAAGPSTTFTVDNTAPTVAITRSDPNPIKDNVLDFQAVFSEPVTGVTGASFVMTNSGVTTGAISATMIDSKTYNVTVANVVGTGTARLDLVAGGATDAAGNQAAAASGGTNATYNVDQTAPIVSSIIATTPSNTTTIGATSVVYTVTFSKSVTGVDGSDFTVTTSGSAAGSVGTVTGSGTTYSVPVTGITGTGSIRLDLNASGTGIQDGVGNAIATGFTSGDVYTIDDTAPTVASVSAPVSGTYGLGGVLSFTVHFSEPVNVTGTPSLNFTMDSGTSQGGYTGGTGTNDLVFQYTVVSGDHDANGIVVNSLALNSGAIKDGVGNDADLTLNGVASMSGVLIDAVPPVVTSIAIVGTSPTDATSVDYTVKFSKSVTGVQLSDFSTASTGTAAGTPSGITGSSDTYTVTVGSVSGDGKLGLNLNSSGTAIFDDNSNQLVTGFTGDTYTIDNTAPTITISAPSQTSAFSGLSQTVTYNVTYNDANFNSSTLSTSDITLNTTSTANGTMGLSGSGTSYVVTISGITGTGTLGITIRAGTATDLAGNIAVASDPSASFTVTPPPTDARLSNLVINPGVLLRKVAGPDYADYVGSVVIPGNTVTVIPTVTESHATITINGVAASSGVESAPITLNADTTAIAVTVTAADLVTKKTYRTVISRVPSVENRLTSLQLNPKTRLFQITGGPDYADYTANVTSQTSSVTVTPVTKDNTSTVTVNGVTTSSGAESAPVTLNTDTTAIAVTVTAADGVAKKTYRIVVTRNPSNIALLTSLNLSPRQALTKVAGADYADFTATVANSESTVKVIPVTKDNTATVTVNGVAAASGVESSPVALNADTTAIAVTVTAGDGVTKNTYRIVVSKVPSNNALLTSLTLSPKVNLVKVSGPDYADYTGTVANGVTAVTVTPTAQSAAASITVNSSIVASGTASEPISLNEGDNTITVAVTAEDGTTTNTYSMVISRQPGSAVMAYEAPKEMPINSEAITVHQNVSPNGDGNSDALKIDGITNYPDNKLQIMSRAGNLVYEVKGYDNTNKVFDGHSTDGKLQQAGTYFYSLEYKVGNETKRKTGYIVLKY